MTSCPDSVGTPSRTSEVSDQAYELLARVLARSHTASFVILETQMEVSWAQLYELKWLQHVLFLTDLFWLYNVLCVPCLFIYCLLSQSLSCVSVNSLIFLGIGIRLSKRGREWEQVQLQRLTVLGLSAPSSVYSQDPKWCWSCHCSYTTSWGDAGTPSQHPTLDRFVHFPLSQA